ncbi:MAG: hypothetical protein FJ106_18650, partial [Deltaproteobacteria bacterium]|nr:hypothetical protein [Deltaproteobacteria bacterium]
MKGGSSMKNLKLSVKLIGGFLIVALITLAVGFVGWRGIEQVDDALKESVETYLKGAGVLAHINEAQVAIRSCERVFMYEKNPEVRKRQYSTMEKAWKRIEEGWKVFDSIHKSKEEEKLWKEFETKWGEWKKLHKEVIALGDKGDDASQKAAYALGNGKARDAFYETEKLLNELSEQNMKEAEEFKRTADAEAVRAEYMSLAGMIIGTVVALLLGFFLSRSITKPINRVVAGLTDGSEQVASASSQVSSASQSLAEGASEQAAGIEETSSSIEEMSSMTRQNADNANQANTL